MSSVPQLPPASPLPPGGGFAWDADHLLRVLRRGWRLVAVAVLLSLAADALYLSRAERVYQARARLLILQQGGKPLNVADAGPGQPPDATDDLIQTHAQILRSPLIVGAAIRSAGLENLPSLAAAAQAGRDPALEAVERLKVTRPDRTARVLVLEYQAPSPEEAVRTVEAITDSYRAFLKDNYQRNNEVLSLIVKARDEVNGEVKGLEKEYLEFHQKHLDLAADDKGRSGAARRLDQWDHAANDAMVRQLQLQAQLDLARKLADKRVALWASLQAMNRLGGDPGAAPLSPSPVLSQDLSSDYVRRLSQEQQELADRYGPQYAKVRELQDQITRTQDQARDARAHLEETEVQDLIGSLQQAEQSLEAMRADIGKHFAQDLEKARSAEGDLLAEANLRNNLERERTLFNAVVAQLAQAQFVSSYSSVSCQAIEPANASPSPVRPRVSLTLLLALAAGLAAGAGASLLVHRPGRPAPSTPPTGAPAGPVAHA